MARVELRERDWEILSALEKWGVLGLAQLDGLAFKKEATPEERTRLFFNETDRRMYTRACYKRLRDLELAGLVKAHPFINHHKVYGLSERGHRLLLERGRARLLGFRRYISEAVLDHELTVNAVGLMIEQLLGIRVRPELERRVRSADPNYKGKPVRSAISDLWIPTKEPKPIEIELTQKAESRYKELWGAYAQRCPFGTQVLYLAGWPGGVKYLRKLTSKLEHFGGYIVYVCGLEEFRQSLGRCSFVNESRAFALSVSLAKPAPAVKAPAAASTDFLELARLSPGLMAAARARRDHGGY